MTPSSLSAFAQKLVSECGAYTVTASELEFYLVGSQESSALDAFWQDVRTACDSAGIKIVNTSKEEGLEQYEISLHPSKHPLKTAQDTVTLKRIVMECATTHLMTADFSARPFPDRPGSGLHIHVHLLDAAGKRLYYKDDYRISDSLKYSIGGLLAWLPDCMVIFAPSEDSYTRFTPGSNAPTTVSWGANNRTVAVRLPMSEHDEKRIEHRVAGADADPVAVMTAILGAIHYGLTHPGDPGPQMYGDASLEMYHMPKLPASLAEAQERFQHSTVLDRALIG